MDPRPEGAPPSGSPVEAGPLWGLVLVLGEIAARLCQEASQDAHREQEIESEGGADADAA